MIYPGATIWYQIHRYRSISTVLGNFLFDDVNSLKKTSTPNIDLNGLRISILNWFWKLWSENIGDSSLIGLECETGNFDDCMKNVTQDSAPSNCNGVLFFSEQSSSCGSSCYNKNRRKRASEEQPVRKGWTLYTRLICISDIWYFFFEKSYFVASLIYF